MPATMTPANGRAQRKSLAGEIDRLDGILDGLAEALDESVADAVRAAVGPAVKEAIQASVRELLSSPALLRAALAAHEPPSPPPLPPARPSRPRRSLRQALADALGGLRRKVAGAARAVGSLTLYRLRQAASACRSACGLAAWSARRARRHPGAAALVVASGALAAAGSWLAGPAVASALCGLGGAAATAAGAALRGLCRLAAADARA